jgi:hypothetical protein
VLQAASGSIAAARRSFAVRIFGFLNRPFAE